MWTDLLWETWVDVVRISPALLLLTPFWLLRGRAHLKRQIAARVQFRPDLLPLNHGVVEFVRQRKESGDEVVLVTASDQPLAASVADRVGLFSGVLGSDGIRNLKGQAKADTLVERYGEGRFDYIGDSRADTPVWKVSRRAYFVGSILPRWSKGIDLIPLPGGTQRETLWAIVAQLRVHQWLKNLLVFVPLMASHQLVEPQLLLSAVASFFAFGPAASAGYLLNDLLDLRSDRSHPVKRHRPLASGALTLGLAVALVPVLLVGAAALAWAVSPALLACVAGYFLLSLVYSLRVKEQPILDVIWLAGLYVFRIFAGHVATGVGYSHWLFLFAMFLFLGLAMVKRYAELVQRTDGGDDEKVPGRGYRRSDMPVVLSLGIAGSTLAILVYTSYITSVDVLKLYSRPALLWLGVPILLYWSGNTWLAASRRAVHEDPILFALKDRASLVAFGLFFLLLVVAS